MGHEFGEYLLSVIDHAFFWFGGIALVIIEILKKVQRTKSWAESLHWEFWALGVLCIFVATFQAWHEEHTKVQGNAVYLVAVTPELIRNPNYPLALSVGVKSKVNVY